MGTKITWDNDRLIGIRMAFENNPNGENPLVKHPNLTRHREWKWIDEPPITDPNQGWGE